MSLERAMYFATLDLSGIKPAPKAKASLKGRDLYIPEIGKPIRKWTPRTAPYSKAVNKWGKKARFVDCDCSCGITKNRPVAVTDLKNGNSTQCRLCVLDDLRLKNLKIGDFGELDAA